jgi:hypothetical protein
MCCRSGSAVSTRRSRRYGPRPRLRPTSRGQGLRCEVSGVRAGPHEVPSIRFVLNCTRWSNVRLFHRSLVWDFNEPFAIRRSKGALISFRQRQVNREELSLTRCRAESSSARQRRRRRKVNAVDGALTAVWDCADVSAGTGLHGPGVSFKPSSRRPRSCATCLARRRARRRRAPAPRLPSSSAPNNHHHGADDDAVEPLMTDTPMMARTAAAKAPPTINAVSAAGAMLSVLRSGRRVCCFHPQSPTDSAHNAARHTAYRDRDTLSCGHDCTMRCSSGVNKNHQSGNDGSTPIFMA